ncbi:hypothetical protein LV75_000168 [Actinokineospora diospyrosa]|uniref:Uncharacterized protein n=2 Tax=Actinokineospora diospyrosa TaxID=103728 RepID=A0ABT1I511_9PSEU|nr:hypothetical protein [Actinokineospora diospyrosa]
MPGGTDSHSFGRPEVPAAAAGPSFSVMSVRYLWWRSCYDGVLHAFPMAAGARLSHQHYRASCTHAAPPDLAGGGSDGPRCELCLLIIGTPGERNAVPQPAST